MLKSCWHEPQETDWQGDGHKESLVCPWEIRVCFSFLPHEVQTSTFFIGEKRRGDGGKLHDFQSVNEC